jgi:MPBQ/MSBQ methyltransferase
VPRANLVPNIADYRARLAAAGFVTIDVTDATEHCLGGFRANLVRWAGAERRAGRMKFPRSLAAAVICKLLAGFFGLTCQTYLLVSARKPS